MRLLVFLTALLPSLGAFAATLEHSHSDSFVEQPEKRNYYRPTCGISGYSKKTYQPYKTIRRRCNQSQCSAYCKQSSKCKSYAMGKQDCLLYSMSVKDNVKSGYGATYKFYDKSCPCPKPSATKTT